MRTRNNRILSLALCGVLPNLAYAKDVTWCVYDLAGNAGDVMQIMKDYVVAAKQWGINSKTVVYRSDQAAIAAFKAKQCDGVVASTFLTREYNSFVSTVGAVGLIPNAKVARQVFTGLAHPNVTRYMRQGSYEAIGWMPVGTAYFMVKDRHINAITQLAGRKIGVLREDPSQERMARRVGAVPVFMTFDNAGKKFNDNEIDILASPIYAYRPLELHRGLGHQGGVINFPISYISLSMIIRHDDFPKNYGQQSRNWFKALTPKMMQNVERWEKSMPNKYWYDIPIADRSSYQRLVAQLRKEFIDSGVYHRGLINMVLRIQCNENEKHFECQKLN